MITRRLVLAGSLTLSLATAALAQSPTTIELWSFIDPAQDNVRSRTLKYVLDTFEAANPDVKVRTSVVQWQEISPQLLRAARAGRSPDVVMLFSPTLGVHAAAGTLQPLDRYLSTLSETERGDLITLAAAKGPGAVTLALPWEMRVTGFVYRKDLFEQAGIAVPRTLPELADAAGKLGQDGRIGFGIGFNPAQPTPAADWVVSTLVGMGAKVLNPDGSAAFVSPEAERLLGFLHELVHKRKVLPVDVALLGETDVQQLSESGRSAIQLSSTQRLEVIRSKSKLGAAYQMMTPPTFDPQKPAPAVVHGWHVAVPKTSRNADAAWKLIAHWTSPTVQQHQMREAGYLPVRRSVTAGAEGLDPSIRWALDYAAEHPLGFEWPENPELLASTVARAVSEVLTDRAAPADALAQAQRSYNEQRKK